MSARDRWPLFDLLVVGPIWGTMLVLTYVLLPAIAIADCLGWRWRP